MVICFLPGADQVADGRHLDLEPLRGQVLQPQARLAGFSSQAAIIVSKLSGLTPAVLGQPASGHSWRYGRPWGCRDCPKPA